MPDILARICTAKRAEIEALHAGGRRRLEAAASAAPPTRGFRAALAEEEGVSLIAEVKRASPSAGLIREDFDPVAIARAYERAGATCVSVLTDREFFQGEPDYLTHIRREVALPALRKDFLLDELQVIEARALGADAFLLIAAALEADTLKALIGAGRQLGMDALVEVHDEAELEAALDGKADLVGINNRNLH
ncbi:MAG: indole-3-glycerol-phosphate synthase, partial [Planctomycetes bacterium]|nr:indole-3-glycerol-phosphate synthase [Planctomycetota bacterium]